MATSECQIDIAFADEATVRHVLAEIGAEVFGKIGRAHV